MKKIVVSKKALEEQNITIEEFCLLYAIASEKSIVEIANNLALKSYCTRGLLKEFQIMPKGTETLNTVIMNSDKELPTEDSLEELAKALKDIFPKGKKEGTNLYWTEGIQMIIRRLRVFFKKYDSTYTPQQILGAAQKYVDSFNGNYTFMRVLRYFIFKEDNEGGKSELINYVENVDEVNLSSQGWTTLLI